MSALQGLRAGHTCYCGKSFARKEHLTRHLTSHSDLAYTCDVCQRQFSRKDVLRRHSLVHQKDHTRVLVSCDVCRNNKTKCSGGTQCSLCARRGIKCSFRSGSQRSNNIPTSDVPTSENDPTGESYNYDLNELLLLPDSTSENLLAENSLPTKEGEPHLPDPELLLNLKIVPSRPVPTNALPSLAPGIDAIHELLSAEQTSLEATIQESDQWHGWLNKCLDAYLKKFHVRWPLFNAPTFDLMTAPLHLTASVCVIGVWLQVSAASTERFWALRVHEVLQHRLLNILIESDLAPAGQAWPIELFQTVLITLIFSLYRMDKSGFSKAMILRSVFITRLREIGIFNTELLASHLKIYFTGPYAPYTLSMREKFKRLIALTYQLDVYFALSYGKPPMLHRQEVGADLPTSFALWNAYGLDIFAKRQLQEPLGRSGFPISEMTNGPSSFKASQLLVEDLLLGLSGVLQVIWVHMQPLPSRERGYLRDPTQRVLLTETLDAWKYDLDKINKLTDRRNISSNPARYLLAAYRGEDNSVAASLERITTLTQDGIILYYYLKLYHCTGLDASELARLAKHTGDTDAQTWRTSKHAREALICGLQMLKMVNSMRVSGIAINPLTRHALAMGLNVTKLLLPSQGCECSRKDGQQATADIQQWTDIDGSICIDNMPVCLCKFELWIQSFEKAIQVQTLT